MKYIKLLEEYSSKNIKQYIQSKGYVPEIGEYPKFVYHATNKNLDEFLLDPDIDWVDVDGNSDIWDIEMPNGYLFLTDDLKEAKSYGKYIIPFEIKPSEVFTIEVDSDSPSIVFDDDFNYGTEYNIWSKFLDSPNHCLEIKGYNRSTFVCYISDIIPRLDIAKEFYS